MNPRNRLLNRTVCCSAAALALLAGSAVSSAQCTGNKLTANDAATGDALAYSVALDTTASGPVAILGSPYNDTTEGSGAGSVYVFQRLNGVWGQMTQFFPNDLNTNFHFGQAVAYADPYVIVGAPNVDAPAGLGCGAFYIYERAGSTWTSKGRFIPFWAAETSAVGAAVDITDFGGGRAIVGAPDTNWDGSPQPGYQNPDSGTAYIYERLPDGTWGYIQAIWDYDAAGSGAYQYLGQSVAIEGDVAVVGAPDGHAPGTPDLSGYIKVLRRTNNGWVQSGPARLAAPDAQGTDLFGYSVDTDGTYIAVGAINHDSTAEQTPLSGPIVGTPGCVYVFKYNAGTSAWDLDGQLFAQDADSFTQLGGTVKIAGGKVHASSYARHSIYTFRRIGPGNWVQESVIRDPESGGQTSFAADFAVAGDAIVVSDHQDTRGALAGAGAAFAFTSLSAEQGNDACSGAKAVASGNHSGCTTRASVDGRSNCGQGGTSGPGPDVWYSWTPACSGNVIIDTFGSDYDTVLSVHSACPDAADSHTIACDDDGGSGSTSITSFNYTAGTTYLIRVAGYNGAAGNYTLRINEYQTPANNSCSTPTTAAIGATYTFSNCRASTDGPSTGSCGGHMVNDVWFRFTAPVTGSLKLDTCGSNFDTMMAIYPGATCPTAATAEFACNDDATAASPCQAQTRTSNLSYSVLAGFPYMIRIGGYDSTQPVGDGVLHVGFVANCRCDWNLSGQVSVQDIFDFLQSYFAGAGDFNLNGQTTVQDIFDFLTCYFAGCQ